MWAIDPSHSEIAFRVKHLMISNVKGVFKEFKGTVATAGEDLIASEIEFSLNPASIDTASPVRVIILTPPSFLLISIFMLSISVSYKGYIFMVLKRSSTVVSI